MGWKLLKQYFEIKHIVQVENDQIKIGSGYVSDLALIDMKTGKLTRKPGWERSLEEYGALLKASPEKILSLLSEPDQFERDLPVYIVSDARVIEEQCEVPGYPNLTHSGRLMYENTTFLEREKADQYALKSLGYRIKTWSERKEQLSNEIAEIEAEIALARSAQTEIQSRLTKSL